MTRATQTGEELARSDAASFAAADAGACGNLGDATLWRCVGAPARTLASL